MNPKFVLFVSTVLGALSVLLYNISTFRKSKHKIVGMHISCNVCDILVYLITGGKSGMVNSIVSLCKNVVYAKYDNHNLTVLFACARIGFLLLNYEGSLTGLIILLEILITITLLKGTTQQLRYIHLCSQIVWTVYDYTFVNAFVAAFTATSCISLIGAIIKNRKETSIA